MSKFVFSFLFLLCSLVGAQTTLPLVHDSDVAYLGSFRGPNETVGTSRLGYGGFGVSVYKNPTTGVRSLFIGGHPHHEAAMAQLRIPDSLGTGPYESLPEAQFLQPFANVVDGSLATAAGITTTGSPNYIYGSLAYNGRLILAAGEYYGCSQTKSHGFSSFNLSSTNDFRGFYKIDAFANVRSLGGPMAHVPPEWQSKLGGPVIGGMWGAAIVSCQSAGPSLTVFNPDSLGMSGHAGVTVVQYPVEGPNRTLCEGAQCSASVPESQTSNIYNLATRFGGLAFPSGTRSVLMFGRQGVGTYCYGLPYPRPADGGIPGETYCGFDPPESDAKGPHAFPYRYQFWAYDANDLVKVKNGLLEPWQIKPYAYWGITALDRYVTPGHAQIMGAGYDPETRRLYVTTIYGESPRVDVFQIRNIVPPVVVPPDTTHPPVTPICSTAVVHDTVPCPSCPPPLPPVTVTVEVPVPDTSVLSKTYNVPGLGVIRKIKTSRDSYLMLDLNGIPVSFQKIKP
jgi:hypothetical protein